MKTAEVAKLMNVSVRTLHYYDEIGLLKPKKVLQNGYRSYDKGSLIKLQQILIFRELKLSLSAIKEIMLGEDYDAARVLSSQKQLLSLQKRRLEHLIKEIDKVNLDADGMNDASSLNFEEQEWELVWNEIYEDQGEVQKDILEPVAAFVDEIMGKNLKKVLDLGCGTGRNAIYMAKLGLDITASDISDKGLEITKKKSKRLGLDIKTVKHDIRTIPYKDDTFDAILCTWVSGHGNDEDMKSHAKEMLRVVKPNGMIFVDYPSKLDKRYGVGIEIEKDTFLENMEGEEKIPHHYSSLTEIEEIYEGHECEAKPYTYHYYDNGIKQDIEAYIVRITKSER